MRTIKFRAWDKREKTMVMLSLLGVQYKYRDFLTVYGIADENGDVSHTAPVMQYTGLKDKNGKEIYEGDILKSAGGNVEVEWFFNRWIFRNAKGRKEEILKEYHYFFEIIGNIYENKDLIEEEV